MEAAQLPNATTFVSTFLPALEVAQDGARFGWLWWLVDALAPPEERGRLVLCMLILCAVYTPIILLAYAAGQRLIEREMARYYDLC